MLARERELNEPCSRVLCSAVGCDEAGKSLFFFYPAAVPQQCCACEKIIFISLLNIIGIAERESVAQGGLVSSRLSCPTPTVYLRFLSGICWLTATARKILYQVSILAKCLSKYISFCLRHRPSLGKLFSCHDLPHTRNIAIAAR